MAEAAKLADVANDGGTQRDARLYERYRDTIDVAPDVLGVWNDTLDTIIAHRSVRAYLPDPVPAGTVELLVAAAQSAEPSA